MLGTDWIRVDKMGKATLCRNTEVECNSLKPKAGITKPQSSCHDPCIRFVNGKLDYPGLSAPFVSPPEILAEQYAFCWRCRAFAPLRLEKRGDTTKSR